MLMALVLAGCSGKKKNADIITKKVETPKPRTPIRMQDYTQERELTWLGKAYRVELRRTADDSLRMVKDETGQKFVDNQISLQVFRADGSVFFSRVFTKEDFSAQLDDDYRNTGILEGIVFDKAKGDSLVFAGSVSHPQTDEYIPFVLFVSQQGDVSIRRDTQLDTTGQQDEEEI